MCAAINCEGENVDLYELQTLPRSGITISSSNNNNSNRVETPKTMAAYNYPPKKDKKASLTIKERLFGHKGKLRKSSTNDKYDVIRPSDGSEVKVRKESKKEAYALAHTTFTRGHRLEPHTKTSWCDNCEELIWGLNIQAIRCQYCRYTCHSKCASDVYVECPKAPMAEKSREEITKETLEILGDSFGGTGMMSDDNNNLPSYVSSITELRRLIDEYNDKSTLIMTLHNDCTFDGFIRVHMNLNRPVNVSTDVSNLTLKKAVAKHKASRTRARVTSNSFRRPVSDLFPMDDKGGSISSSSYDSGIGSPHSNYTGVASHQATSPPLSPADTAVYSSVQQMYNRRKVRRKLSFYMPKGTYKPLHVTSSTTVREVIEALLAKYNVTDNPKKYALFIKERKPTENDNEVVYKRLQDEEHPLVLLLSWGPNNNTNTFALKEDEDGNVEWMNFELPELENFLRILQLEEDQLLAQIIQKYEEYRVTLETAFATKNIPLEYR